MKYGNVLRANQRRFYTDAYRAAHGRAPRGFGMWVFTRTVVMPGDVVTSQNLTHRGTYGEAKRAAIQHAAPEGALSFSEWTVNA